MPRLTLEETRAKLEEVRSRSIVLQQHQQEEASRASSFKVRRGEADGEAFAEDFLHRLEVAERRDHESLTREQEVTADALDALLLDSAVPDFGGEPSTSAATNGAHAVMPTPEEIRLCVQMYWKSPAAKREGQRDSTLAVAGSFVVPNEAPLDEMAFCKMLALVQKPALGVKKGHSAAQKAGWEASFSLMDYDGTGALTREKVRRFLDRRKRAFNESLKAQEEHMRREELGGHAIAVELRVRVDTHLHHKRSRESALAALEEAMGEGAAFNDLFSLATALAPRYFGCERATLWIARDATVGGGADDADWDADQGGSFSQGASFKSASFKSSGSSPRHGVSFKSEGGVSSKSQGGSFKSGSGSFKSGGGSFSLGRLADGADRPRAIFTRFCTDESSLATSAHGEDKGAASAHATSEVTLAVNSLSIAGTAVDAVEPQLVANAYTDARFDTSFDERTGFVTRAIMCVPLVGAPAADAPVLPHGRGPKPPCLGCLQLINKLPKEVVPPAEFNMRDLRDGAAFCAVLSDAIAMAGPREAERCAREAMQHAATEDLKERNRAIKERRRKAKGTRKGAVGDA